MEPESQQPLSRREFLRAAGLVGLAWPVSNLLRSEGGGVDVISPFAFEDEAGRPRRPWWVRSVDQPTIEVDWSRKERFDAALSISGGGRNLDRYLDEAIVEQIDRTHEEEARRRIEDDISGYTLKDFALLDAQRQGVLQGGSFLGPEDVPTPEQRGVDRWRGSPEEAARVLRVAMRHFGAAQVGFVRLDERTRRLIYSHDRDGKELIFEDVAQAYETETKRVIPNGAEWVIAYTVRMSFESIKRAPTVVGAQSTMLSYNRGRFVQSRTQAFLRGLGYQCLGQAPLNGLGMSIAFCVLSGLGEMSRLNRMISPEYGPMVRTFFMLTDLPVAEDKPIDAGIQRFCGECKKCAESCPANALSYDDQPQWETRGEWNSPGHRAFFEDSVSCIRYWRESAISDCSICFSVCPFSKKDKAWMHDLVKAGIAAAPALNGFFRSWDDAFSYGAQKDPADWWHMDLPEYGLE